MKNTRCGSTFGQRDMYHILAPQSHGQDGAFLGKKKTLAIAVRSAAHAPRLIELPPPVFAGIGGVDQEVHISGAGGGLDAVRSVDEVARAGLHPEPVERVLPKRAGNLRAEIGRDLHVVRLERAS
ncbi:MAG TPA: hypothetical protein VFZ88_04360, partial [Sphingomicrobium sp.]